MSASAQTVPSILADINSVSSLNTQFDLLVSEQVEQSRAFIGQPFFTQMSPGENSESRSFEILGDHTVDPAFHTPGVDTKANELKTLNVTISLTAPVEQAARIDKFQLAIREVFNRGAAYAIRNIRSIMDQMNMRAPRVLVNGARQAAVAGVHDGGNRVVRTGVASLQAAYPKNTTGAANFEADLAQVMESLANRNLGSSRVVCAVQPYIVSVLTTTGALVVSRDFADPSQANRLARRIGMLAGAEIIQVPAKFFPSTNVTNDHASYNGDFSIGGGGQPAAIIAAETPGAIGAVSLHAGGDIVRGFAWQNMANKSWQYDAEAHYGMGVVHPYGLGVIDLTT
ncbi:MAG: hypothetical protein D6692_05425 [Planctomycetota bacterium]|nr:MAG: hypothetical protein D6692_05425 [Planctomycetota bacterium]